MANAGCVLENMVIAATSLGIDNIIHGGAPAMLSKAPELLKKPEFPNGYKPVPAAAFGYAVKKEEGKGHRIGVNRV